VTARALVVLTMLADVTGGVRAAAPPATIEALPGTVVRWSLPGTKRCAMGKRAWAALQETCYYPIDVEEKPGVFRVSRQGAGPISYARIKVLSAVREREDIALADIPQAKPSPDDRSRAPLRGSGEDPSDRALTAGGSVPVLLRSARPKPTPSPEFILPRA